MNYVYVQCQLRNKLPMNHGLLINSWPNPKFGVLHPEKITWGRGETDLFRHQLCVHWTSCGQGIGFSALDRIMWVKLCHFYPLVMADIAIENGHRNSGFTHWTWWFSIATLVYQRVPPIWEWYSYHHRVAQTGFYRYVYRDNVGKTW